MRTRRRRKRFTWFPITGTAAQGEGIAPFQQQLIQLNVLPTGAISTISIPVVPDSPTEPAQTALEDSLSDIIGSEYVIERICGACFVSVWGRDDDPPGTIFPKLILVTAGFFVGRSNDAISGGDLPIGDEGTINGAVAVNSYSGLALNTIREPWMWRRTWLLHTGQGGNAPFTSGTVASDNRSQTGLNNTSSLDVKSVRRVGNDDRLWFNLSARSLDNDILSNEALPTTIGDNTVSAVLDYRVLGALRKAKNSSTF